MDVAGPPGVEATVADAVRTAVVTRNYPIKIIWEKKLNKFAYRCIKTTGGTPSVNGASKPPQ
jgi:hypothetical protein